MVVVLLSTPVGSCICQSQEFARPCERVNKTPIRRQTQKKKTSERSSPELFMTQYVPCRPAVLFVLFFLNGTLDLQPIFCHVLIPSQLGLFMVWILTPPTTTSSYMQAPVATHHTQSMSVKLDTQSQTNPQVTYPQVCKRIRANRGQLRTHTHPTSCLACSFARAAPPAVCQQAG